MRLAVLQSRNILVSGPTGSGKTTWTKALIREIPADERLITIEDARPSWCSTGIPIMCACSIPRTIRASRASPKQLLESCLRMKPDRILLAELRAEEAFDYLRNVNSGHPGSITSVHATSAELAFEQLVLLVKQKPCRARTCTQRHQDLLYLLIDVVIQFGVEDHERFIKDRVHARIDGARGGLRHGASSAAGGVGQGARSIPRILVLSVLCSRFSRRNRTRYGNALSLLSLASNPMASCDSELGAVVSTVLGYTGGLAAANYSNGGPTPPARRYRER
jgi:energy-coupling factor transporter ATP-binding protein EcfA2